MPFRSKDFDKTINVNVRAAFVAIKAAAKHLTKGGRIINIGSINADSMPFQGGGVYAMSKAAIQGMTRGFARDFGPLGITINNIQPGPVNTDMNPETGEFADYLKNFLSVGRYGQVEEIAGLAAYLAGPEAGYINGASLNIDGGFTS
ncbi:SDR family oxidoreductase [Flavobacterium sp.]|uniref:SDR family oxidoreductase n=1 Tax=Flavobacterium sp. TaxID=239 RepID=UPI0039E7237B